MSIRPYITAVAGGIGSGKSVVCRALRCMGYDVYDCDSRAKQIMDNDPEIKRRIAAEVCADALGPDGELLRQRLSEVVFADPTALQRLNAIVHGAVRADILRWAEAHTHITHASSVEIGAHEHLFVETAILYQSGLDRLVDDVWEVTAPVEVRVARVCSRNGFTPEHVMARIEAQRIDFVSPHPRTHLIDNSGLTSLLLRLAHLLGETKC